MDTKNKLMELMEGVGFRCYTDCDSPEQLMKLGEHGLAQYEALGEERQQRVHDLICGILADVLQPRALTKYGDASYASIRRVLVEELPQLEGNPEWEKCKELAKQTVANQGFSEFQVKQLYKLFDFMTIIIVELIAQEASRFHLLPRENAATIALVLRDMFQEANHAEFNRRN